MPGGIVTLTTDFGLSDHYVGVMKGVILTENPQAQIVDLCHQVEPYDVLGGALTLEAAWPYFPEGTVHVAVVDPGVGGPRRPILALAAGSLFLAPDNGVLELVYRRGAHRVLALSAETFARQPISNTFHGRDVFAPAAGRLSRGQDPQRLGDPIEDYVRLDIPAPRRDGTGRLVGRVLKVDRFGNLLTNLRSADLPPGCRLALGPTLVATRRTAYAQAPPGEVFALEGSSGYIEISMNQASAAAATGAAAGTTVEVLD